jgi:hypothetical protein
MNTIKIIFIFALFHFVSCGNQNNNNVENSEINLKKAEEKKKEIEKLDKQQTIDIISKRFDASDNFDNANYNMTYQYQNLIRSNNRVIISRFNIANIEKLDSNYIVTIIKVSKRKMFIEFICNQNQIQKICPDILESEKIKTHIKDRYLILKINSIKKIKYKIIDYEENYTEAGANNYIDIDESDAYICKGDFIDTYLKPKK